MAALEAVIFDVDGTLADTERDGHRPAFNAAFAAHGLDFSWTPEEYGRLLEISGGHLRIAHALRNRGHSDIADRLAAEVHATKTALFRDNILGGDIAPRPGLINLVASLRGAGIRVAVATTGRRAWVEPLVRQILGDEGVEVMVTGGDVLHLKPDPEAYLRALDELDLRPESALAVEDSAIGLRAALGAQLATVIVTNGYTADQDFSGAAAVQPSYEEPLPLLVDRCRQLHDHWWVRRIRG